MLYLLQFYLCISFVIQDPKGYRSVGEARMKGHGFCSVISITPDCFGSLVLRGGANKDLSR